jgi:hypothetical protein
VDQEDAVTNGPDAAEREELDLAPSPRLLEMLGEIPFKAWQCFAELIDNSFDEFLRDEDRDPNDPSSVHVTLPKPTTPDDDALVCVADNGRGMSKDKLEQALRAGYSENVRYGSLGLFGMGFNIATARLGFLTEVRTTRAGDPAWCVAEIDFPEMRKKGHFRVPLRRDPKDDISAHGTEVIVRRLRSEMRETLKRTNTASSVRDQLGNVYSYLLRTGDPVPEVPDGALSGKGFALYVNGTRVQPWLPCVWSSDRTSTYRGAEVSPIQVIDRTLPPALACLECGYWHRTDVEECVECGSGNLELRERKVTGWLGIQRYLDLNDFGIDILRNGRKILISDHSLFSWEHPDTGERLHEYPVELGTTQGGRIVGEIHLDHVPVTYQKSDFIRGSRDWITAINMIRGEGPLLQKKAKALGYPDNDSPLGHLFNAFRRNDPGLKCLIPGDGKVALHQRARQWAKEFRKGRADFLTDQKWFEAARDHDEVVSGLARPVGEGDEDDTLDLMGRTGLGNAGRGEETRGAVDHGASSEVETEEERYARYRDAAVQLHDLSGPVSVGHLGRRNVTVFDTRESLEDLKSRHVPTLSRNTKGGDVEVYVQGDHEIFREYGRDPRDYAIVEIAEALRAYASGDEAITRVTAEVTRQFPDQRLTDGALRERAEALLRRIRDAMVPAATTAAKELWAELSLASKEAAERNAANTAPRLDWKSATADSSFVAYLDGSGIAALIRMRPDLFLDGAVFSTTWEAWGNAGPRTRQVERLARLLETIGGFLAETGAKSRLDLAMTRLTLEMLADGIAAEDPS